ncbi:FxsA family protein [Metasolibacillus sp.]|uniref:FxsA family protein n=1 Tax=Metasolibacillus sp. TaxID=2703680 RepID=UPI0025EC057C|nr:FxsA family protein [Metasolibacillus sp.]MCT6925634.1 FxsA family protein [Metasolibacillus sp.]MCT6941789.1 FxsA family protein [Metasolibacillus sp.]
MPKILLIFIAASFAEIATFIIVGKWLGVFATLLLVIATSLIGAFILKNKGLKSFQSLQQSIAQGKPPGVAVIETFALFISGVLLLVPGFLTDLIGLLLLMPITRKLCQPLIFNWVRRRMKSSQIIIEQK